jgi:hypothetical protein
MSATPQGLTPFQVNGAESEQWKLILRQALVDLRVAVPGIIQDFDPVTQTATVQIALKEVVRDPEKGPVPTPIAPIYKVPVVLPRAGGFSLTLPLAAGDECLLIFADMCIDLWWTRGGVQEQFERRRHDLSDCFCVPGPWSQPRKLSNYSAGSAQLRSDDGSVIVDVAESGITLKAPTVSVSDNLVVGNGATGSFTTPTGQTVTVQDGIITNIY